jgi:hypothetical protein
MSFISLRILLVPACSCILFVLSSCRQFRPDASALVEINGQSIHLNNWEDAEVTRSGNLYLVSVKVRSADNKWVFGGLGTIKADVELPYTFDLHNKESIWALILIHYPNPKSEIIRVTYGISDTTTGSITLEQLNPAEGGHLLGSLNYSAASKTDYSNGETSYDNTMKAKFYFGLK